MTELILLISVMALALSLKAIVQTNKISGKNAWGWKYLGKNEAGDPVWQSPDGKIGVG